MDVSVVIPARNEQFLARTIESIFAAARAETEIIAVIDGEHKGPEPQERPGLRLVRNDKPIGQRQCVNLAARMSQAKYILKTDGHSMFDEGFDVKLMADCEYDWTVIPRMYNLHAFDLVCGVCGLRLNNHREIGQCPQCQQAGTFQMDVIWQPKWTKKTDWMYFRSPDCEVEPLRVKYYGNQDFICTKCGRHHEQRGDHEVCRKCGHNEFKKERAFPAEFKAHRRWAKKQGDIAEVMNGQGACWFMHRQRFWDLDGMDEGHGGWGQMGVEVACKAWLSGGKHIVNRKTWFSHFFRCGNGPHFPYSMSGRAQERARKYSIDFWTSGQWEKQVRPLEWLADKFAPVPTWDAKKVKAALAKPKVANTRDMAAITPRSPEDRRLAAASGPATTDPIVSVIIPARNEQFLHDTVVDLQKNLREPYEIIIGFDGRKQDPSQNGIDHPQWPCENPNIRAIVSDERIGMRPMINLLASKARGRFLMKIDAHVAIDAGMDIKLIDAWEPCGAVVPHRYDLDTKRWKRRRPSRTDCRRLTHKSEDGVGLRALDWPEYSADHKDETVIETMACSGSCWLMERLLFERMGGWDENHGTFGQEGCELACKIWLSGGRLLLVKNTWYAHWNRGKSTYSLGASEKPKSIKHSHDLWLGNKWPLQKYSFEWLLDHFDPPGWPQREKPATFAAVPMGNPCKNWNKGVTIADLWEKREGISEPAKKYRLDIFWMTFEAFVRSLMRGAPDFEGRYKHYLVSHLKRTGLRRPSRQDLRHVQKKMESAARLFINIRDNGFKSPLEFYRDEQDHMILWKGYRRLVIAHVLGIQKVPLRALLDRHTAQLRSPQNNMIHLQYPPCNRLKKLCEEQFQKYGVKASDKYFVHGYHEWYDRYFAEMQKRTNKVLELGVARGASLALWSAYFPKAQIFGADIVPDRWKQIAGKRKNVRVLTGDEEDPAFLSRIAAAGPYDIIIDDADHHPRKQAKAFEILWPAVREHGYYVIEDTYRSFADNQQGRCLPPDLEQRIANAPRDVSEYHWHLNIVFLRKAPA